MRVGISGHPQSEVKEQEEGPGIGTDRKRMWPRSGEAQERSGVEARGWSRLRLGVQWDPIGCRAGARGWLCSSRIPRGRNFPCLPLGLAGRARTDG
jgi:hypothetical protein